MDRPIPHKIVQTHSFLSIDAGGTATFGNDTAIDAIDDAVAWSIAQGRTGPFLLSGTSMGFCDLMAWARLNPEMVTGAIGWTPAVNLTGAHAENRGGLAADIDTAYGGAYVAATHAAAHDPTVYADELEFPIIIFGSTQDTLATTADHTAFAAAAPDCEFVNLGAAGDHTQATVIAAAARAELSAFIDALI